jgi:predicted nucleic acid-binding protein
MSGTVFDAGALIAFEKGDRRVVAIVVRALERRVEITVPAGVVGRVWRNGRTQARLVRLLGSEVVRVESLDDTRARAAGQLCAVSHTSDVIDASVALCARQRGTTVVTSDPNDLRKLAPDLELVVV